MTGYVRQATADISAGEVVRANPLNLEFNAIQTAFNAANGHAHDGSIGGGPRINLTTSVTGVLPVANGGTGSGTAAGARTNLGLAIGTDVQGFHARLQYIVNTVAPGFFAITSLGAMVNREIVGTNAEIQVLGGLGGNAGGCIISLPTALNFIGKTINGGTYTSVSSITTTDLTVNANFQAFNVLANGGIFYTLTANAVYAANNGTIFFRPVNPNSASHQATLSNLGVFTAETFSGPLPASDLTGTISDATHGSRAGGSLHADATASTSGFMPSTDKAKADNGGFAPTGAIMAFASQNARTGWVYCNGQEILRTGVNADLFTDIGTTWGPGNGINTFNVPDFRGVFLRGYDNGRGLDAGRVFAQFQSFGMQSHTHTASSGSAGTHSHGGTTSGVGNHQHLGGTTDVQGTHTHNTTMWARGDAGSQQNGTWAVGGNSAQTNQNVDAAGSHGHNVNLPGDGAHSHTIATDSQGAHTHTVTVGAAGIAETRPSNYAINYFIKL